MDRAQAAKNKGNKYFKAGSYENAIQCYTEAIGLCPIEQKSDLSTFYQNRAAAFEQQVGKYSLNYLIEIFLIKLVWLIRDEDNNTLSNFVTL